MINTVIFDLDGTLINSIGDLGETVNKILEKHGYPMHSIEKYCQFVGDGVLKLIERALPDDVQDNILELKKEFDEIYSENCLNKTAAYEGIEELLKLLIAHDFNLAVVTNKPHGHALKITKTLFPDTFAYIFGNSALHPKKPHPCLTNLVIDLFDVKKNEVVYIGDSDVDILTAKNAKIKSIGVAWGFRGREELEKNQADYVVDKPMDIWSVINDWNK